MDPMVYIFSTSTQYLSLKPLFHRREESTAAGARFFPPSAMMIFWAQRNWLQDINPFSTRMVCLTLPRFGRALTRRPTSASVSRSENDSIFQAELRCEDMERFCIVLGGHPQIGGLVIIDTAGSKAVDRWNDANPGQKIEIGYAIIEVNGITKLQDMLQEFREAKVASILVQAELCPKQLAMLRTTIKIQRRKLLLQENLEDATFLTKCGETCSICHEEMNAHDADVSRLPCGHCFHKTCVTKWLVYGSLRCPLCNHEVGRSDSQNN